jgi:trans-2,3-dihydro-3-hydroxyanthranilate isomerase
MADTTYVESELQAFSWRPSILDAMARAYLHYDVFTSEPFTGNQLAVFLDGRGVPPERMQAIAREMSFSETTFIMPAETAGTDIRMRIFTPGVELPMAGHPTIGSTFALAHAGMIKPGTEQFVFGLGVGPTPVALEWDASTEAGQAASRRLRFAWMTQRAPEFGPLVQDAQAVAAALGVRRDDLAGGLPIQQVSCGVPFLFVAMATRAAVDRAVSEAGPLRRLSEAIGLKLPVFLFTTEPGMPEATAYSRMFSPHFDIAEDPATGGASGPLGSYLVRYGLVRSDVQQRMLSLQGHAMGRPSRIHIRIGGTRDNITSVEVGGEAVLVARGEMVV